jgi:malic enzyme
VLPLSNPTSFAEATPGDVLAWTGGRALVATGSPFEAVTHDGRRHEIGQANNVFIFPGVGLGAIVAESSVITDTMFLRAATELAASVSDERLATGALFPPIATLRAVSRRIAIAVAHEAGCAAPEAEVDAAMWWPAYVPYRPIRSQDRRRAHEL